MSTITFSTISAENTKTNESTSIVVQTVTFCFIPEAQVFRASASCKGAPVRSSGTWLRLKLWVRTPWRRATMGSIFRILPADSHTTRATAPTMAQRVMAQDMGRKCTL